MKKFTFYFEPDNPITNPRVFTDELINYCKKNNNDLTIIHEGMEPIAIVDDVKYVCMLEQPKMINIPIIPAFYAKSSGFKWVYLYKYEE